MRQSKRNSLLKSPQRNSAEISEAKVLEELSNILKIKFYQKGENEIVLNLNVQIRPFNAVILGNLDTILDNTFDIFSFEADCLNNSLFLLMNYYYKYLKFETININESSYINLIYNIQKNYNDNPYHNSIHASDVVNTLFYFLEVLNAGVVSNYSVLDKLILLLSGATHDIDHPGNTNIFEINTRSVLALTYNDKSVLENYHLFLFFNFLNNKEMNIFINFDLAEG